MNPPPGVHRKTLTGCQLLDRQQDRAILARISTVAPLPPLRSLGDVSEPPSGGRRCEGAVASILRETFPASCSLINLAIHGAVCVTQRTRVTGFWLGSTFSPSTACLVMPSPPAVLGPPCRKACWPRSLLVCEMGLEAARSSQLNGGLACEGGLGLSAAKCRADRAGAQFRRPQAPAWSASFPRSPPPFTGLRQQRWPDGRLGDRRSEI